jgi:hypothetical protein
VTAVGSGLILGDLTSKASTGIEFEAYNRQTKTAYDTLTWSSWALVGTAALGILEAQLAFKRERPLVERKRALPPELEIPPEPARTQEGELDVEPNVSFGPGGAIFGVSGTF